MTFHPPISAARRAIVDAARRLTRVGFLHGSLGSPQATGRPAAVALLGAVWGFTQSPPAPTPVIPNAPATAVVPTGECHPNYEPCLPIVDDLNCPDIRMAVQVTGDDPYRLDQDGNGIGRESYL